MRPMLDVVRRGPRTLETGVDPRSGLELEGRPSSSMTQIRATAASRCRHEGPAHRLDSIPRNDSAVASAELTSARTATWASPRSSKPPLRNGPDWSSRADLPASNLRVWSCARPRSFQWVSRRRGTGSTALFARGFTGARYLKYRVGRERTTAGVPMQDRAAGSRSRAASPPQVGDHCPATAGQRKAS